MPVTAHHSLLERLSPYAYKGQFIIDFDAAKMGISENWGLISAPVQKTEGNRETPEFLMQGGALPGGQEGEPAFGQGQVLAG